MSDDNAFFDKSKETENEIDSEKLLNYLKSSKEKEREAYLKRKQENESDSLSKEKFYQKVLLNKKTKNVPVKEEEIKENEIILENNRLRKEKKVDNYFKNLARKIQLNLQLYALLRKNFYYNEFNNTRNSIYLGCAFPIVLIIYFISYNHNNPMKNFVINFSFGVSACTMYYFFRKDIEEIVLNNANKELAQEICNIKNELAVYNPLTKSYLDQQENEQKI